MRFVILLKIRNMDRTIISFDYATREILRDKANFNILSGFLTELLEKPVTVLEVLDSEVNATNPATQEEKVGKTGKIRKVRKTGKASRMDLKAKMDDGEIAVFEIQYFDIVDFMGKILFNACMAVVEQIRTGMMYDIKKVYSINISYYGFDADDEYVFTATLNEFKGIHYEEVIPFSQKLNPKEDAPKEIHPEYFLILPNKFEEEEERKRKSRHRIKEFVTKKPSKSKFDEWVYVLKHSVVKSEFTAAGIQACGEKLDILKMTPEERAAYKTELKAMAMQKSVLQTAKIKGRAEGEVIGLKKGEKIGLKKGEEIGLKKGEEIGLKKGEVNAVIRCRNKGLSIDTIADVTDLSTEQIIKILKENGLM